MLEGESDALAMPFVFESLGLDANHLGVSVVDCGSKTTIPFYAAILRAFGIPFVVLADQDGANPVQVKQTEAVRRCTPPPDLFFMSPDFEGECGYVTNDKVMDAYAHFSASPAPPVPAVIRDAVNRLVAM